MQKKTTLTALAVALALTAGCGQSAPPGGTPAAAPEPAQSPAAGDTAKQQNIEDIRDKALVTVNGQEITGEMFGIFYNERLQKGQRQGAKNTPQFQNQAINELINILLLAKEAEKSGIDKRPDVITAAKVQHDELLATVMLQQHAQDNPPSEEELKKAYDEYVAKQTREEYKARHILVKTEEEAAGLIKELDGGADFATLAKEHSTGPTGPNGGDLGWFGPGQMVKPFTEALQALGTGSYTKKPVQTQFGWHVILLEDKRQKEPPAFDAVRPQLQAALQRANLAKYVSGLRESANVEVNKSLVKEQTGNPQPADK